jgi:hypothetical protein
LEMFQALSRYLRSQPDGLDSFLTKQYAVYDWMRLVSSQVLGFQNTLKLALRPKRGIIQSLKRRMRVLGQGKLLLSSAPASLSLHRTTNPFLFRLYTGIT